MEAGGRKGVKLKGDSKRKGVKLKGDSKRKGVERTWEGES